MKINYADNPLNIQLPFGAGYINGEGEVFTIETIRVDFSSIDPKDSDTDFFEVCIDEQYFISDKFDIIEDHTLSGKFTRFAEDSKGGKKTFPTIFDRAMGVCAAVLKGNIKYHPDLEAKLSSVLDHYECQTCNGVFKELEDLETDGDINGTCPDCKKLRIFIPCNKSGMC